jgi:DNA-binding protein H-NS
VLNYFIVEPVHTASNPQKKSGGWCYKSSEKNMKDGDLISMSIDELWDLHQQVIAELDRKIAVEKATLDERLRRLGSDDRYALREKRPYPKVSPKYRNPKNRSKTWAGRGKQPRWLVAQLRSGKKLEDFQIKRA